MNNDLSKPQSPDLKNGANNLGKALYSLNVSESLDNLSWRLPTLLWMLSMFMVFGSYSACISVLLVILIKLVTYYMT